MKMGSEGKKAKWKLQQIINSIIIIVIITTTTIKPGLVDVALQYK